MQVEQGKYGETKDVYFEQYEVDGIDLRTDWVPAAADCQISTDGGAFANSDNIAVVAPTGTGLYKVVLSASEMTGKVAIIKLVDAATKVFLDRVIKVETYGNASAQHPFDMGTASVAQGADNNTILSSINIANGAVESDLTRIHGSALTETAGQLAAAFVKLYDVATPTLVASDVMRGTDGANQTVPDAAGVVPTLQEIWEYDVSAISNTDRSGGILLWLFNLSEGDEFIDITTTPWQFVKNKKDTPGTEYLRKDLSDVNGDDIASVATVIGKKTEP